MQIITSIELKDIILKLQKQYSTAKFLNSKISGNIQLEKNREIHKSEDNQTCGLHFPSQTKLGLDDALMQRN